MKICGLSIWKWGVAWIVGSIGLWLILFGPRHCHGATAFTYTSSTGVKYDFSPESMSATFQNSTVIDGNWHVNGNEELFDVNATSTKFGEPTGVALAKVATNSVRVTQTYANFKVVTTWKMSGEDAHITTVVSNVKGPTVECLQFDGLTLHFARRPDGWLKSWHWTWLQHVGTIALHPSQWVPVGAAWAADDEWGFSAYTQGRFEKPKLFHAEFEDNNIIPQNAKFQYLVPERLEKGDTKTFDVHLRISKDRTYQHLLAPYKALFKPVVYKHQDVPVAWFSAADVTWIRQDNPYGYGDNGGDSPWRRLDKPDGAQKFLTTFADAIKAKGGQGLICWTLGGVHPRGGMYRTDFDVFPPEVVTNIPVLSKGFKDRGLKFGVMARPAEAESSTVWGQDNQTIRLNSQSKSQMDDLRARFKRVVDLGIGEIFYLDTFGCYPDDINIMKEIRKEIGDRPTYSEYGADVFLVYSGQYLEYSKALGYVQTNAEMLRMERWLVPGAGFILKSREDNMDAGPLGVELKAQMREDWRWLP